MRAHEHNEQEVNNWLTMPLPFLTNRFKSDSFQPLLQANNNSTSRPVSRVLSRWGLTHHGWPFIWSLRCRKLHATNPGGGPKTVLKPEGFVPPLFGFAPGGVCRAKLVAKPAVRSYRTVSPLPKQALAVYFLWHFPWGHPRRALPGTLFPWSPDFPPPHPFGYYGGGHPADWW
jgi:hypothetical protein